MKHSFLPDPRLLLVTLLLANALSPIGAVPAAPNAGDWNVADHIPLEHFVVQSHRGAGFLAEENTLPAFELGWKLGTYPEADVRTTRDGVLVAFHDADFKRVVTDIDPALREQGVEHVAFETLARLDVGAWKGPEFAGRRVPKLADVFAAMRGHPERNLYLDLKHADLPQLARDVQAHGVARQVVAASPTAEVLREWKALVPESGTLLWMRGDEETLRRRFAALRETGFAGLTQVQIHIFPNEPKTADQPFKLSNTFIRELGHELRSHQILFQTLPYTDDPGVYAQLLDLGVASFATDYPDVTMREIRAYYAARKATRAE